MTSLRVATVLFVLVLVATVATITTLGIISGTSSSPPVTTTAPRLTFTESQP